MIQKTNLEIVFIYFLIHLINHLGFQLTGDYALENNQADEHILKTIKTFNNCNNISLIDNLNQHSINKIKIILYKHIKNHLFRFK